MTKPTTETATNFPILQDIYDRQHYFIDRHESMGKKLLSALVLTGGLVSIVFTLAEKMAATGALRYAFLCYVLVFFAFFVASYFAVSKALRPLSSKALSWLDLELLPSHGKDWVKASRVYYRGILERAAEATKHGRDPVTDLMARLNENELCVDLSRQIIILAYYSDYKRKYLERATKLTTLTILIGIIALLACVTGIYLR